MVIEDLSPMTSVDMEPMAPVSEIPKYIDNEVASETLRRISGVLGSSDELCPLGDYDVETDNSFDRAVAGNRADLKIGGSAKSFEKRHGLRESKVGRFMKKNITNPVANGVRSFLDLTIKSMGQSKLDWFRLARLQISDKYGTPPYSNGVIPFAPRFFVNFGGTSSMASLLMAKTGVGKAIIRYRQNRRDRIDRLKDYFGTPFRKMGAAISRSMPWYERRYKLAQGARSQVERLDKGQAAVSSWMHGGISGMRARVRRNKMLKQKRSFEPKESVFPAMKISEKREDSPMVAVGEE